MGPTRPCRMLRRPTDRFQMAAIRTPMPCRTLPSRTLRRWTLRPTPRTVAETSGPRSALCLTKAEAHAERLFREEAPLQFAGAHVLTSLFAFNVGVELGQLLVVALLAPLVWLVFRFVVPERVGIVIASALAAHTAWHWMIERGSTLAKYEWWPPGPAGLATAVRMLMVVVAIAAVRWVWMRRRAQRAAIAKARK